MTSLPKTGTGVPVAAFSDHGCSQTAGAPNECGTEHPIGALAAARDTNGHEARCRLWLVALGLSVRRVRKQRGVSSAELAGLLGIAPQSVRHWESGRNYLGVKRLWQVAHVLGVQVTDLLPIGD